ncbi:MAG: DUF2124 domain-containing protein [Candidatus Syntrophoarchaeum sp. WYZ-LMO15]|nr:MAG: DUF2124 domain-containing protein [Candidatus Syntrophoarchaeum sp. WYZ-LMO15]
MGYKGIGGILTAFRDLVDEFGEGTKIVFVGSVGVCTPLAELLAYAVRNKGFEMIYIPNADVKHARRMKLVEGIGYRVTDDRADPTNPDVILILGGLAMPKYPTTAEDVLKMIKEIGTDAMVLGLSFMGSFEKMGWRKVIPFDHVIDGVIDPVTVE